MTSGIHKGTCRSRATACWTVLYLFLALFSLGLLAAMPASAETQPMSVELLSSPVDSHSDCDHGHAGVTGHCSTTTACFGYAQAAPASALFEAMASVHAAAVSEDLLTGRSTPPNLRPPKRPIQV